MACKLPIQFCLRFFWLFFSSNLQLRLRLRRPNLQSLQHPSDLPLLDDMLPRALLLGLCAGSAALLLPTPPPALCTPTRLTASRVAALSMCDAEAAAPAEPPAAPVEAAAAEDAPAPRRKPPRASKKPLEELVAGTTVEGTIRSVQSYGAFVDIGESETETEKQRQREALRDRESI